MSTKHDKRVKEYYLAKAKREQAKKDQIEAMKIRPKDLGIPPGGFERGPIKKKKK